MSRLLRLKQHSATGVIKADEAGELVLFADVEEALRDATRYAWLMPVFEGRDEALADRRAVALAAGLTIGLSGNALVDWAMEGVPQ